MADEQTPPAGGRQRRIPVPMPILIGLVVAIGAGIYLMRRNATKAAAQPAATTAQPPVILAGNGGGGIPSGYLYTLLQNLQSSPAATPTAAPAGPYDAEKLSGSGYYNPGSTAPIAGLGGGSYQWLSSNAQWQALNGQQVYVQPTPGQFVPYNPAVPYASGTPVFAKVS